MEVRKNEKESDGLCFVRSKICVLCHEEKKCRNSPRLYRGVLAVLVASNNSGCGSGILLPWFHVKPNSKIPEMIQFIFFPWEVNFARKFSTNFFYKNTRSPLRRNSPIFFCDILSLLLCNCAMFYCRLFDGRTFFSLGNYISSSSFSL
mmetsp:Transcript_33134/g.38198  ORF Transcript_33134/g.38198 Transcript_33134/m.38198 type:complete len:148 (-) Transcript_33134:1016-1459(-)